MTTIINSVTGLCKCFLQEDVVIGWHREVGEMTRRKKTMKYGNYKKHKYIHVQNIRGIDGFGKPNMFKYPHYVITNKHETDAKDKERGIFEASLRLAHYTLQDAIKIRTKLLAQREYGAVDESWVLGVGGACPCGSGCSDWDQRCGILVKF
jgi:hypothetical protein